MGHESSAAGHTAGAPIGAAVPPDTSAFDRPSAAASPDAPLRIALAQLTEGVIVADAEGRITFVNAAAERLHGVARLDVPPEAYADTYALFTEAGDPYPSTELPLARAVMHGETVTDARWRIRRPDGSEILAIGSARPLLGPQGERLGAALTLRDDTPRADAERALRHARTEADAHAEESARLASRLRVQADEARAANELLQELNIELETKSEQLQEAAAELEMQAEELQATTDDLAARTAEAERAREEAERARAEADAANRAKSEFLAVMSHELRTPLNAIAGYAQLMQLGVPEPALPTHQEYLERIQRSQTHLLGLINAVLNYARIEAGHVDYALRDVAVGELLAVVEPLVRPQLAAKSLAYACLPCERTLRVHADPDKVAQILLNLVSNAVKFTPAGGRITLAAEAAEADEATVAIRVADTGVGIPADKLRAIFDPFVQVDGTLTRADGGAGLGLAISRDLARGMGGELAAASVRGAGSTFALTLPGAASG